MRAVVDAPRPSFEVGEYLMDKPMSTNHTVELAPSRGLAGRVLRALLTAIVRSAGK